jgi:hypothetical protein
MNPNWYIIVDTPRNQLCWNVNPNLWVYFSKLMADNGIKVIKSEIYTEQYVVQTIDFMQSNPVIPEIQ